MTSNHHHASSPSTVHYYHGAIVVRCTVSIILSLMIFPRHDVVVLADALLSPPSSASSSYSSASYDHDRGCGPRRNRHSSTSSPSSLSSIIFAPVYHIGHPSPGRCRGHTTAHDDVGVGRLFGTSFEDDGGGVAVAVAAAPWWSKIRNIGMNFGNNNINGNININNNDGGHRRRPWRRREGARAMTSLSPSAIIVDDDDNQNDRDADDIPRSDRRRRLLPLSLMMLLGPQVGDHHHRRRRDGSVESSPPIPSSSPPPSYHRPMRTAMMTAKTTTTTAAARPLALGAAISSFPIAMGRLLSLQFGGIGRNRRPRGEDSAAAAAIGDRYASLSSSSSSSSSTTTIASHTSSYFSAAALSSRGGGGSVAAAAIVDAPDRAVETSSYEYYRIVETPLFPIILPPSDASTIARHERTTTLEISIAAAPPITHTARDAVRPYDDAVVVSESMIAEATRPLLSRDIVTSGSFTGRELYDPRGMEGLARTGLEVCSWDNEYVRWTGEKRADKFVEDHGRNRFRSSTVSGDSSGGSRGWYEALDSSQEVLVWVGKFVTSKMPPIASSSSSPDDYYGSELPIIKTVSVIRKSPKYLAELLMDSSKVKAYNKMSMGRTDMLVFQSGIDTLGGNFGDGASKVVRNLTRPPLVSGIVEFVTCMHARMLRSDDFRLLGVSGDDDDGGECKGYVVVSRAVVGGGGSFSSEDDRIDDEKLVRNEILLGVNVLRAVPGEPDKTELTSVTHVYSPMIPKYLAKSAGVKGATDFVRDIRAMP